MTGGILTGECGNQSLHQSLSSNSNSDSWCDTYRCPCLMGGPLSGSIKGDTHQLNHTSELRDAAVKTLAMINVLNGSDDKNVE